MSDGPRFLILGCGKTKRPDSGLMPAIERYNGPTHRIVRNYLRANPGDDLRIWTLSSTYWAAGFLPADTPIPYYDVAPQFNRQTLEQVTERLPEAVAGVREICICVSPVYLQCYILPNRHLMPEGVPVRVVHGDLFKRVSSLKAWLEGRWP